MHPTICGARLGIRLPFGSQLAALPDGYASAAAVCLAPLGSAVVAALLPWAFGFARGGQPTARWVLAAALALLVVGPAVERPAPGSVDLVAVGGVFGPNVRHDCV